MYSMAPGKNQKLKLLYLMDMLYKETDDVHGLTMPQILRRLEERGIKAERKSIYADLDVLRNFGLEISKYSRQPVEYALGNRDFSLSELTLLVDAVQSCRFLSDGKSKQLVKGIRNMASTYDKHSLDKRVHVFGRPHSQSQSDFNMVDTIQEAMAARCKITFIYYRYDAEKKRVARKDGAAHIVTPVSLVYSDGNYYLVGYSDADEAIRNYRVDRMGCVRQLVETVEKNDVISAYDPDDVAKCAFGMYAGKREIVLLRAKAEVMNVIIDRFGKDVESKAVDNGEAALVTAPVMVSPVFFGWLAQMGSSVTVEQPQYVRDEYLEFIDGIKKAYE